MPMDKAELARADTFSAWIIPKRKTINDEYRETNDDGELIDEEYWDWPVLLTRIFCFILAFCVLLLLCLAELNIHLAILASFVFAFLLLILFATYVDITWMLVSQCFDEY